MNKPVVTVLFFLISLILFACNSGDNKADNRAADSASFLEQQNITINKSTDSVRMPASEQPGFPEAVLEINPVTSKNQVPQGEGAPMR
ncbi:hypothetical protein MASR1M74_10700 [Lentimicrobium sp.]